MNAGELAYWRPEGQWFEPDRPNRSRRSPLKFETQYFGGRGGGLVDDWGKFSWMRSTWRFAPSPSSCTCELFQRKIKEKSF